MEDSPPLNYGLDNKKYKSLTSPVLENMQITTQPCTKYWIFHNKVNS